MKRCSEKNQEGSALVVVLVILMITTVTSLVFLYRSDMQMACGKNAGLKTCLDYLADSGLTRAKAMIVSNQSDPNALPLPAYSQNGMQIDSDTDDYYDLSISDPVLDSGSGPSDPIYFYTINSSAYRLIGGEQIAKTSYLGTLRLDPSVPSAVYIVIDRQ